MDAVSPKTSALVLIDVINDFSFPAGRSLLATAVPAARRLAALKKQLSGRGVPVIYVNDNFGDWKVDFRGQIQRCLSEEKGDKWQSCFYRLRRTTQAATLRLLLHIVRCSPGVFGNQNFDFDWLRNGYLRSLHRERRLHAWVWIKGSRGLRGCRNSGPQSMGIDPHEDSTFGEHQRFDLHPITDPSALSGGASANRGASRGNRDFESEQESDRFLVGVLKLAKRLRTAQLQQELAAMREMNIDALAARSARLGLPGLAIRKPGCPGQTDCSGVAHACSLLSP